MVKFSFFFRKLKFVQWFSDMFFCCSSVIHNNTKQQILWRCFKLSHAVQSFLTILQFNSNSLFHSTESKLSQSWRGFLRIADFPLDFQFTKHWFFHQTLRIHEIIIGFPRVVRRFSRRCVLSIPNKYELKHGKSRKYIWREIQFLSNVAFELQK